MPTSEFMTCTSAHFYPSPGKRRPKKRAFKGSKAAKKASRRR